jgi:hypothetical protein
MRTGRSIVAWLLLDLILACAFRLPAAHYPADANLGSATRRERSVA